MWVFRRCVVSVGRAVLRSGRPSTSVSATKSQQFSSHSRLLDISRSYSQQTAVRSLLPPRSCGCLLVNSRCTLPTCSSNQVEVAFRSSLASNASGAALASEDVSRKALSTHASQSNGEDEEEEKKLSLLKRFHLLWKRYWYIVIPVHIVTSIGWFGAFYVLSMSGVDVVAFLEWLHLPDSVLNVLKKNPNAGHVAVAYALYKVVSPARYTVTIGGTHISMKVLSRMGLIPTTKQVRKRVNVYVAKKRKEILVRRARLRIKYGDRFGKFRQRLRARRRLFTKGRHERKGNRKKEHD